MIPDETLTAILEAREAATAGEWFVDTSPNASPDYVSAGGRAIVRCYQSPNAAEPSPSRANAAFIVLACNNAAELVREVRALRAEVAELKWLLKIAHGLVADAEFLHARSYSYGRGASEPSPAEWGIGVGYQETVGLGAYEQFEKDVDKFHADELVDLDTDDPDPPISIANRIAQALKDT